MSHSIRTRMTLIFIGVTMLMLLAVWAANTWLLEDYYVRNKIGILERCYTQIDEILRENPLSEMEPYSEDNNADELSELIKTMGERYNTTIVLVGDTYYLTGTSSQTPAGFTVLLSDELEGPWRTGTTDDTRFLLTQGTSYGTAGFWAPQWIQLDNNVWGLAYTANEQTALAWSDRVTGPFRQDTLRPIDASAKNIDPFLFRDDDGKCYLYHVRFDHGNYIWVAEFDLQQGTIRPETLRRCLDNLVDNALRYSAHIVVRLHRCPTSGAWLVDVEDDGPGIPPENREQVFEPFFRLDPARGRHEGGSGLGLSIARSMARQNNADLHLLERPGGGLIARLTFGTGN